MCFWSDISYSGATQNVACVRLTVSLKMKKKNENILPDKKKGNNFLRNSFPLSLSINLVFLVYIREREREIYFIRITSHFSRVSGPKERTNKNEIRICVAPFLSIPVSWIGIIRLGLGF